MRELQTYLVLNQLNVRETRTRRTHGDRPAGTSKQLMVSHQRSLMFDVGLPEMLVIIGAVVLRSRAQ